MTEPDYQQDAGRTVSNIPIPDPTTKTTDFVRDSIQALRDLLEVQINATKKELESFRAGHEEKHHLVVDAAIRHRKELSDASITILRTQVDTQHKETNRRLKQQTLDVEARLQAADRRYQQRFEAQTQAVDAAFQAQQEAAGAALASAKEALDTALQASERAVGKADTKIALLIPRGEVEARIADVLNQSRAADTALEITVSGVVSRLGEFNRLAEKIERADEAIKALDRVTTATFVTFRTLVESQSEKVALALDAATRAVDAAFASSAAAILKAEAFNEKRFDIATKEIDELKTAQQTQAGKSSGLTAGWGYIVAAVGLIVLVVNFGIALVRN